MKLPWSIRSWLYCFAGLFLFDLCISWRHTTFILNNGSEPTDCKKFASSACYLSTIYNQVSQDANDLSNILSQPLSDLTSIEAILGRAIIFLRFKRINFLQHFLKATLSPSGIWGISNGAITLLTFDVVRLVLSLFFLYCSMKFLNRAAIGVSIRNSWELRTRFPSLKEVRNSSASVSEFISKVFSSSPSSLQSSCNSAKSDQSLQPEISSLLSNPQILAGVLKFVHPADLAWSSLCELLPIHSSQLHRPAVCGGRSADPLIRTLNRATMKRILLPVKTFDDEEEEDNFYVPSFNNSKGSTSNHNAKNEKGEPLSSNQVVSSPSPSPVYSARKIFPPSHPFHSPLLEKDSSPFHMINNDFDGIDTSINCLSCRRLQFANILVDSLLNSGPHGASIAIDLRRRVHMLATETPVRAIRAQMTTSAPVSLRSRDCLPGQKHRLGFFGQLKKNLMSLRSLTNSAMRTRVARQLGIETSLYRPNRVTAIITDFRPLQQFKSYITNSHSKTRQKPISDKNVLTCKIHSNLDHHPLLNAMHQCIPPVSKLLALSLAECPVPSQDIPPRLVSNFGVSKVITRRQAGAIALVNGHIFVEGDTPQVRDGPHGVAIPAGLVMNLRSCDVNEHPSAFPAPFAQPELREDSGKKQKVDTGTVYRSLPPTKLVFQPMKIAVVNRLTATQLPTLVPIPRDEFAQHPAAQQYTRAAANQVRIPRTRRHDKGIAVAAPNFPHSLLRTPLEETGGLPLRASPCELHQPDGEEETKDLSQLQWLIRRSATGEASWLQGIKNILTPGHVPRWMLPVDDRLRFRDISVLSICGDKLQLFSAVSEDGFVFVSPQVGSKFYLLDPHLIIDPAKSRETVNDRFYSHEPNDDEPKVASNLNLSKRIGFSDSFIADMAVSANSPIVPADTSFDHLVRELPTSPVSSPTAANHSRTSSLSTIPLVPFISTPIGEDLQAAQKLRVSLINRCWNLIVPLVIFNGVADIVLPEFILALAAPVLSCLVFVLMPLGLFFVLLGLLSSDGDMLALKFAFNSRRLVNSQVATNPHAALPPREAAMRDATQRSFQRAFSEGSSFGLNLLRSWVLNADERPPPPAPSSSDINNKKDNNTRDERESSAADGFVNGFNSGLPSAFSPPSTDLSDREESPIPFSSNLRQRRPSVQTLPHISTASTAVLSPTTNSYPANYTDAIKTFQRRAAVLSISLFVSSFSSIFILLLPFIVPIVHSFDSDLANFLSILKPSWTARIAAGALALFGLHEFLRTVPVHFALARRKKHFLEEDQKRRKDESIDPSKSTVDDSQIRFIHFGTSAPPQTTRFFPANLDRVRIRSCTWSRSLWGYSLILLTESGGVIQVVAPLAPLIHDLVMALGVPLDAFLIPQLRTDGTPRHPTNINNNANNNNNQQNNVPGPAAAVDGNHEIFGGDERANIMNQTHILTQEAAGMQVIIAGLRTGVKEIINAGAEGGGIAVDGPVHAAIMQDGSVKFFADACREVDAVLACEMQNMDPETGEPRTMVRTMANSLANSTLKEFAREYLGLTYAEANPLITNSSWPSLPVLPSLSAPILGRVSSGAVTFCHVHDSIEVMRAREKLSSSGLRVEEEGAAASVVYLSGPGSSSSSNRTSASKRARRHANVDYLAAQREREAEENDRRRATLRRDLLGLLRRHPPLASVLEEETAIDETRVLFDANEQQQENRTQDHETDFLWGSPHSAPVSSVAPLHPPTQTVIVPPISTAISNNKKQNHSSSENTILPDFESKLPSKRIEDKEPVTSLFARNVTKPRPWSKTQPFTFSLPLSVAPERTPGETYHAAELRRITPTRPYTFPTSIEEISVPVGLTDPLQSIVCKTLRAERMRTFDWFAAKTSRIATNGPAPVVAPTTSANSITTAAYVFTTLNGRAIQIGGLTANSPGSRNLSPVCGPISIRLREYIPAEMDDLPSDPVAARRLQALTLLQPLRTSHGYMQDVLVDRVIALDSRPWSLSQTASVTLKFALEGLQSLMHEQVISKYHLPPYTSSDLHAEIARQLVVSDRSLHTLHGTLFFRTADSRILVPMGSASASGCPLIDPFKNFKAPLVHTATGGSNGIWMTGLDGRIWLSRLPRCVALPMSANPPFWSMESAFLPSAPYPLLGPAADMDALASSSQDTIKQGDGLLHEWVMGPCLEQGETERHNAVVVRGGTTCEYKKPVQFSSINSLFESVPIVSPASEWAKILPSRYRARFSTGFFLMDVSWFTFLKHVTIFLCILHVTTMFKNVVWLSLSSVSRLSLIRSFISFTPTILQLFIEMSSELVQCVHVVFFTNRWIDPYLSFTFVQTPIPYFSQVFFGSALNENPSSNSFASDVSNLNPKDISSWSLTLNTLVNAVFDQGGLHATITRGIVFAFIGVLSHLYIQIQIKMLDAFGRLVPASGFSLMTAINLFTDFFFFVEAGVFEWLVYPQILYLFSLEWSKHSYGKYNRIKIKSASSVIWEGKLNRGLFKNILCRNWKEGAKKGWKTMKDFFCVWEAQRRGKAVLNKFKDE